MLLKWNLRVIEKKVLQHSLCSWCNISFDSLLRPGEDTDFYGWFAKYMYLYLIRQSDSNSRDQIWRSEEDPLLVLRFLLLLLPICAFIFIEMYVINSSYSSQNFSEFFSNDDWAEYIYFVCCRCCEAAKDPLHACGTLSLCGYAFLDACSGLCPTFPFWVITNLKSSILSDL